MDRPVISAQNNMADSDLPHTLFVEDNPDTRLLMSYLLSGSYNVAVAGRVDEALDLAERNRFDFFLLDINLGEQRTGVDLLHLLRQKPEHANTPAIALTAYALPGDRDNFLQAGFDAYLSKPFTPEDLQETIAAVLTAKKK